VLWVYLAALVVGGGVIGLQFVFAAGHGDVDLHHDVDHTGGGEAASIFLSSRFWTFALLAFGLVGTLLTFFRLAHLPLALALSIGSGLSAGLFAAFTMRALKRSATTSVSTTEAVGKTGRVILPCAKDKVGKVRVSLKGNSVDLLAMTDEAEIPIGQQVLIDELRGDIAHVTLAPRELTE
jgi:membrane protein implicated in regulation of membrane protease activity